MDLGGQAIAAALTRSEVASSELDEVIFGHVLVGGEGQITARQAAVGLASRSVRLGEANFVMAGGMESMSNAPYMVRDLRSGLWMGDASMVDVMVHDGLFCAFDQCTMGEMSDGANARLVLTHAQQNEWAAESHRRAAQATESGHFAREIVPVEMRVE